NRRRQGGRLARREPRSDGLGRDFDQRRAHSQHRSVRGRNTAGQQGRQPHLAAAFARRRAGVPDRDQLISGGVRSNGRRGAQFFDSLRRRRIARDGLRIPAQRRVRRAQLLRQRESERRERKTAVQSVRGQSGRARLSAALRRRRQGVQQGQQSLLLCQLRGAARLADAAATVNRADNQDAQRRFFGIVG